MARAVAQYVFAALLALLSTQAAVPSRHLESPAKIVWCAETEQQAAEQIPVAGAVRREQPTVEYTSRVVPAPDSASLFQRPPPATSLFV